MTFFGDHFLLRSKQYSIFSYIVFSQERLLYYRYGAINSISEFLQRLFTEMTSVYEYIKGLGIKHVISCSLCIWRAEL